MIFHSDLTEDNTDFTTHFADKSMQRYNSYNHSTIVSPVIERSHNLQYKNDNFGQAGSTISYESSVATRTGSFHHTRSNNYIPNGQMYTSATMMSHGSQSSQYNTMDNRHWSPPSDFSHRVREPYTLFYSSLYVYIIMCMHTVILCTKL